MLPRDVAGRRSVISEMKPLRFGAILILGFVLQTSPAQANKTDIVIFNNGDWLTGEIKGLDRGKLTFKTDATDKIQINWTDVAELQGSEWFRLERTEGEVLFGQVGRSKEPGMIQITTQDTVLVEPRENLVGMIPIEKSFWKRVDGSFDVGISYTSANDHLQWSITGTSTYRTENYVSSIDLSSILSTDSGADRTSRQDLNLQLTRLLPNRFLITGSLGLQSNQDLGFDLRTLLGGQVGVYLMETPMRTLEVSSGVNMNREKTVDTGETTNDGEAALGVAYERFTYENPERDVTATLDYYKSLTVADRYRVEASFKVRWEVVKDFFIGLSILESYDSKPPEGSTEQNDLSISNSIGYSF
jgi:uncharacterized protein DUF481